MSNLSSPSLDTCRSTVPYTGIHCTLHSGQAMYSALWFLICGLVVYIVGFRRREKQKFEFLVLSLFPHSIIWSLLLPQYPRTRQACLLVSIASFIFCLYRDFQQQHGGCTDRSKTFYSFNLGINLQVFQRNSNMDLVLF